MIDKSFEEITIGEQASFSRRISMQDVEVFSDLSGDKNPLHVDEEYARGTKFGGRVVHGMLLAAFVSGLVGMHLPGKRSLLLSSEFRFKLPARIGDKITTKGTVKTKSSSTRIMEMDVEITRAEEILAEGAVRVQILERV